MSKENLENEEFENEEEWEDSEDSEDSEVEVYTLEDEEGNESEFALIKRMDIEGQSYVAFEPFSEDDDSPEDEDEEDSFVILKVVNEDGEEVFVTIEDDDEFDRVADIFEDELMEEISELEDE